MPSPPSASKNATCSFTPTTYGETASISPRQKRAHASAAAPRLRYVSPRSSTGRRSGRGSRPTSNWLRFPSTASARRSAKVEAAVWTPASRVSGIGLAYKRFSAAAFLVRLVLGGRNLAAPRCVGSSWIVGRARPLGRGFVFVGGGRPVGDPRIL